MRPTRPGTLVLLAAVAGVLVYLVAVPLYEALPPLPAFAPLPLVFLAGFELALARVVRARVQGRQGAGRRPMHPLQIARTLALAKASSPAGALLVGVYAGLLAHLLPLNAQQARTDALVAGGSLAASLLLAGAGLLLERACRTPDDRDDRPDGPDRADRADRADRPGRDLGSRG